MSSGRPSFADVLFATLTVHAQPQISELVHSGICRPRTSVKPPQTVAGLQVPTGGTVAVLILAGERRENFATLTPLLDSKEVTRRREVLRTQMNRVAGGDARSFQSRWFDDLAYVCALPTEVVDRLREAQNLPGEFDPKRVEQEILHLLVSKPVPAQAPSARSRPESAPDLPVRFWKRRPLLTLSVSGLVTILASASIIVAISRRDDTAADTPGCDDIGVLMAGIDSYWGNRQPWWDAYNRAGGKDAIGCPVQRPEQGYVHRWGRGMSQDIRGADGLETRLMALNPAHVVAMTREYWFDYTRPHLADAAELQGYPTSDPVPCGNAKIVPLDEGRLAPGAMVSTPANRYAWLPGPVWRIFQQYGGAPVLGRPVNSLAKEIRGHIAFEHGGSIEMVDDHAAIPHLIVGPANRSANDLCPG
ncbi:hypothetical protein [Nocardia iowensis]|uniref:hypothetical protein n=1 Tax=Nocardia iowensis TaxID=204891 RepID=UPI0031E81943